MSNLYCIPSLKELKKYAEFAKQYNAAFEYNEFFIPSLLDDEEAKNKAIDEYLNLNRDCSQDTLHGAFLDICVNSDDKKIFAVSDYRVRQCMDIAEKMDLKAVVFHTNYIVNFRLKSYLEGWIDRNEKYWRSILKDYPKRMIYIENMFDDSSMLLKALAKRMTDEPRFAVCLDIAHAAISGTALNDWFLDIAPYTAHMHINDNDGIEDLHKAVGSGVIDWMSFNTWALGLEQKPSVLIEVRNFTDLIQSVKFMEENKIYPFV